MTASSSSNVSPAFQRLRESGELFHMFREQVRVSRELFESLREQMILQVSSAIKPLVVFLRHHECDEDEILAAIFEAIAYEKDAEPELGMLAVDKFQDWSQQTDEAVASRFSQAMYRIGMELFRDFQNHRLYQHGFLPYQYRKMHGQDVLVERLGVPEILHREFKDSDNNPWNPLVFGNMAWKPELIVVPSRMPVPQSELMVAQLYRQLYATGMRPQAPAFKESSPVVNRTAGLYEVVRPGKTGVPADELLGGMAQAFKNFHERDAAAQKTPDSRVTIRHADGRVERNVDEAAIQAWEKEMQQLFAGLAKKPAVRDNDPPYEESHEEWLRRDDQRIEAERDRENERISDRMDRGEE